jgi:hypothetical protein
MQGRGGWSGERHAHHPATGELTDVARHIAVGESEPGQDASRLGIERVAAQNLEPMLQPPVLGHQLLELRLLARLGQLGLDVAHPSTDAAHLAGPGDDLVEDAPTSCLGDFLAQVADDHVLAPRDRSGVRLLLASDDLEQRRLAGAVRPDDGDAPPGGDLQADAVEQVLRAVALGEVGERDQ